MEIGIRELRARLSHYVKAASAGEQIVITDRGLPVAELSPARGHQHVEISPALQQLIAEGRATAPRDSFTVVSVQPAKASRTWQEILDEDRGED
ncbi:MAG: type II toxin-antitoxin system prevent-host-death family antitoxin [Actinomycetota bacterium]|nr:type II toxin-antitoxin system prevent-host-death family antitoxin [Actinomycetota bacterium]